MLKRALSYCIVLILLLPCLSLAESSGTCGNLTWTLTDGGTLVISGSGEMDANDAARDRAQWIGATRLEVESGVTAICENAFLNCVSLETISLPATLERIGASAFKDCLALTVANIPNSVTSIGASAFQGCWSLRDVLLPENLSMVPENAFLDCYSLQGITIPDSVIEIDNGAFQNCGSLQSAVLPSSLMFIDSRAFYGCSGLKDITLPEGLFEIDDQAFANCGFTVLSIPDGVSVIMKTAFDGITGLRIRCKLLSPAERWAGENNVPVILTDSAAGTVVIPEDVRAIPDEAFAGTAGVIYTLPEGLTSIGERAFADCVEARYVRIPSSVTSIADSAFDCSNVTLVCYGIYAKAWAESRHFPTQDGEN